MDYMSNKALIIAVSLIVTMIIASGILYTINQIRQLYKQVYETDTLIQSNFDEFSAYDGGEKTYLELMNAIKKYKDSDTVYITFIPKDSLDSTEDEDRKIIRVINSDGNLKDENYLRANSLYLSENEQGKIQIQSDSAVYKLRYNTYVERLNNGKVIIIFNRIT